MTMLSILLLSLAAAPAPQQGTAPVAAPAAQPEDPSGPSVQATQGEPQAPVWPAYGAVEAPRQPRFRSNSIVRRTPRRAPVQVQTSGATARAPISSLCTVRGMESNHLMGIGLVTGLAGTGDSNQAARQLLQNLLLTRNINIDLQALTSKNIAVVRVEASLPAGIRAGQRIDIRVSTIGDAESLLGGSLAMTELTDITGRYVYAVASGPLTVGGFSAEGNAASATRNHVTVGTLPGGGKVEQTVDTSIVSNHGFLHLDLRTNHDSLGNSVSIADAVNGLYPGTAEASLDGKSVAIRVPADLPRSAHAAFAHSILSREVESTNIARVIVNERSGVIVMGGNVRLLECSITHGNLTVRVSETPEASQPGAFSQGTTETLDRTQLEIEEQDNPLMIVPNANTLQEVVDTLNALGATPRDLIIILQSMSQSGRLLAEVRSI